MVGVSDFLNYHAPASSQHPSQPQSLEENQNTVHLPKSIYFTHSLATQSHLLKFYLLLISKLF